LGKFSPNRIELPVFDCNFSLSHYFTDQIVSGTSRRISHTSFQLPMTVKHYDNQRNIDSVS